MTVTVDSFRQDFGTVFSDTDKYPDSAVNFWLSIAALMLNTTPAPNGAAGVSIAAPSGNVLTFFQVPSFVTVGMLAFDMSNLSVLPATTAIIGLTATTITLSNAVTGAGVAAGDTIFFTGGQPFSPRWGQGSATPSSPPTTLYDWGLDLFAAHNLVLEKAATDTSATGGNPGYAQGIISSKSVGGVSISYDTAGALEPDAGHWSLTIYGSRFIKMARFFGSGPIQLNIGHGPAFALGSFTGGGAWPGPWPFPQQGDVGFG